MQMEESPRKGLQKALRAYHSERHQGNPVTALGHLISAKIILYLFLPNRSIEALEKMRVI